jgi:hypothetical protein
VVRINLRYRSADTETRFGTNWGGGIKGGVVHGETDEYSYDIPQDAAHVRDLQATILHQFGIDHERLSYKYQGLDIKF